MIIEITLLIVGIYLIVKSADWLIDSSISLSSKLKVSPLVVGLTVVAFGTSLPELIVNIISAIGGEGQIAMGNIIGSNIANIMLILGIGAVLTNLKIKEDTSKKEVLYAFLASLILFFIVGFNLVDGVPPVLTRANGLMLLVFLFIYLSIAYKKLPDETVIESVEESNKKIIAKFIISLILLFISGEMIVRSTINLADEIGISTYLISALIIAVGTSLPELATTVRAAMRKQGDLLVGNLIGSNIFNTFGVLGISSLIRPLAYPPYVISDLFILLIGSYFVFLLGYFRRRIEKPSGITLIAIYVLYVLTVVLRR